jgi:hypothetical protein
MSTGRIIAGVILVVIVVLPLLGLARMGWRILIGKDEFVTGGSMGNQMTSPVEHRHLLRRFFRLFRKQRHAQQL